ncbi:MAG TPA: DUF3108 domain-containing protein [Pseudorhodoplanes sp.]|nr:DUF3108 domain-containing protein [Pseudorhodoplanes sp.]
MILSSASARLALLSAALIGTLATEPARAQGRLEARYTATLAGLPLGKGAWIVDISDDQYTAAASGLTTGLVRVFAPGEGSSAARGQISAQRLTPLSYAATITSDRKSEDVRMAMGGGSIKDYAITPPTPPARERIPVTDAHLKNVLDPMSGTLVWVPGNGDILTPDACRRQFAVFDGRMRYDLNFEFKRMEQVKAEKGYRGPVVVCAVYFSPIAGYIPDRPAIKYLIKQRDMEVWLAPIAGTRVLVPFRFSIPTPLGTGILEATQFVATPQPAKASVKTQ